MSVLGKSIGNMSGNWHSPMSWLRPKIPQYDAGTLIDPPESLPIPIGESNAAIAAASPPLDPPGVRVMSCGLFVLPNTRLSVSHHNVNSGVFVLPINMPPAFFNRSTTGHFRWLLILM